ncbi:MAG: hypothetical protein Q8R34_00810 [bacterium]|nr:hypothetical protein [bacterium]
MTRTMKKLRMGPKEKNLLAEWDPETITEERLKEIKEIFDAWLAKGVAFNVTLADQESGAYGVLMKEFDKEKDILLYPRVQGGGQ